MGNIICSLDSNTDFPPLNQMDSPTRFLLKEDIIEEEDNTFEENEDSDSSDVVFVNISFQEALTRERTHSKRRNNILNLVTLRKEDSRYQTPGKKVWKEDSGWWKLTGKNVVPENKKNEKD